MMKKMLGGVFLTSHCCRDPSRGLKGIGYQDAYKLLEDNKKDKKLLTVASEHSKNKAHGLREVLEKKIHEVEEGKKLGA
ncbi:hypothetical protein CFP56_013652 [Quercus suber]|uniref:Uncharacterized protein n=1 Tax=Quercus suber TaxID=58331 RepID=A0AAW0KTH1_QUESU